MAIITDLRGLFGPVRDQGARPTCIAFATSDAHAAVRGPYEALSVEHLYWHAVQRTPEGRPEDGVNLPTILTALEADGQSLEVGWPYLDALPADLSQWVPPASAAPVLLRSASFGAHPTAVVRSQLDAGRPSLLCLRISDAFFAPDADGLVSVSDADLDAGYHAVVAVAHGTLGHLPVIMIRNSWGEVWGLAGHAWLPDAYLGPRLIGIATMSATRSM
jgi:hypothetical protein